MELQLPKGTRDFAQGEKLLRDRIVATLKETFELYGFAPLETPIFERYEVLASKYAGGAEILKETFKLKDQGNRDLGLRYDLTVPLARFIGMNPTTKMPFKRYQIGEVFRDGPVATARYRQFTQCDVDVVGASSLAAEAEIIALANYAFKKLGLDATIKFNSRKLLNDILDYYSVPKEKQDAVILSIDKLEKFGETVVKNELKEQWVEEAKILRIMDIITLKGTNEEKISQLKKIFKDSEGMKEVESVLQIVQDAEFDVSLARGLSYYTGIVIECYLKDSSVKSSVCGGGRYDNMIGAFLGNKSYPAVGVSFGLDRIYDAMLEKEQAQQKTNTKVFIIPINTVKQSIELAQKLRDKGINTDVDLMDRSISKNLDYANSLGIPYTVIIGKKEIEMGKFKLKDMKSGNEEMLDADEIINKVR